MLQCVSEKQGTLYVGIHQWLHAGESLLLHVPKRKLDLGLLGFTSDGLSPVLNLYFGASK
jgi:hypothetical protein